MVRVVIVDDRATNRAIYTPLARSIGQNVVVHAFGDPVDALDWLQNNHADLIVTDYDMPRIHGEEFITRFRALPGSGGVPIMMITVCDQRQLRLRALESGATDFLRAPIDHCEFLARARNLLKLSRGAAPARKRAIKPPQENSATARRRAVACLRKAWASAREVRRNAAGVDAEEQWRLAPVVDLGTGALAGAQFLRGDEAAAAADVEALRGAMSCAAETRRGGAAGFRVSLRLGLAGEGTEGLALGLPALLAYAGAAPSRLEFVLCAQEILADRARAERLALALQAIGIGMTLDLCDLSAEALMEASISSPLLYFLAQGLSVHGSRPSIRFACTGAGGVETGRFLRAWIASALASAPILRAQGVPSPALLPLLRRAGVELAEGPCFGAPFALRDLETLLAAGARDATGEIEARRA